MIFGKDYYITGNIIYQFETSESWTKFLSRIRHLERRNVDWNRDCKLMSAYMKHPLT